MKNKIFFIFFVIGCLEIVTYGHDIPVHRQITYHAAAIAYTLSPNYKQFLDSFAPKNVPIVGRLTPPGWLIEGSAQEDNNDIPSDKGGIRSLNHFYDPLSGLGLSEVPFGDSPIQLGQNSFYWASTLNAPVYLITDPVVLLALKNPGVLNQWSWQNARNYQYLGITASSKSDRDNNLGLTFHALGRVVHLLEDTSQPQHVRNEQHVDTQALLAKLYQSPIEKYGAKYVSTLNYTEDMLDWRVAGFTKMQDFWDRDFYTWNRSTPNVRSAQALIDSENSAQPTKKLGLAEFVNGNFIGDRHTYAGIIPLDNAFYYPYPDLNDGTDWNLLRQYPGLYAPFTSLPAGNGDLRRFIVTKTGQQGRQVAYHGAVNYLVAVNPNIPFSQVAVYASVDDPDVLKCYHDILIPEAIKYSAGLLDYFFRGKISVDTVTWNAASHLYTIRVVNKSGETFKDGAFKLMTEDSSGVRTPVQTVNLNGTLPDNNYLEWTFPGPVTEITKCILVYKGTIGLTGGGGASDPVDDGIAIGVTRFILVPHAPDENPCPDCPDCTDFCCDCT